MSYKKKSDKEALIILSILVSIVIGLICITDKIANPTMTKVVQTTDTYIRSTDIINIPNHHIETLDTIPIIYFTTVSSCEWYSNGIEEEEDIILLTSSNMKMLSRTNLSVGKYIQECIAVMNIMGYEYKGISFGRGVLFTEVIN